MDDATPNTKLWYAITGNNGSVIGMGRLLGAIGAILLVTFLVIHFVLA